MPTAAYPWMFEVPGGKGGTGVTIPGGANPQLDVAQRGVESWAE